MGANERVMVIRYRDIADVVEKQIGGKVLEVIHSKHSHVHMEYNGHDLWVLFPKSPSDTNWARVKYCDIRKELKRVGVWKDT